MKSEDLKKKKFVCTFHEDIKVSLTKFNYYLNLLLVKIYLLYVSLPYLFFFALCNKKFKHRTTFTTNQFPQFYRLTYWIIIRWRMGTRR